jgi:uncharacterized protein (DUF302 family)
LGTFNNKASTVIDLGIEAKKRQRLPTGDRAALLGAAHSDDIEKRFARRFLVGFVISATMPFVLAYLQEEQKMEETAYGLRTEIGIPYDQAVETVTAALKEEGFGILTSIDVKETLKKKLDVDFRRYIILGACNPPLAHRALTAETEIGLMLPCNVVVYEKDDGGTVVAAMAPLAALGIVESEALHEVAKDADARLRRVVNALGK